MRDALTRIARENERPKQVEHTVVVRLRRSASRGKLERTGLLGEAGKAEPSNGPSEARKR